MKLVLGLLLCLGSVSACGDSESEHRLLMDLIESKVLLPEGSSPIDEYSRNYAVGPNGKVFAIYVFPPILVDGGDEDFGCSVMLENFDVRPCNAQEIAESKQRDAAAALAFGAAGESRWFDNYRKLPVIDDGGCAQVTIIFDPRSQKIESASCNGSA